MISARASLSTETNPSEAFGPLRTFKPIAGAAARDLSPVTSSRLRYEFLTETLSTSLGDARQKICAWRHDYDHHPAHCRTGNITPVKAMAEDGLETRAA